MTPPPRRSAADGLAATLAVVAGSLLLYALSWGQDLGGGGIALVGAERVLAGEIPYRDFWTMYAPGHFYLLAGLFALFGNELLVSAVGASVLCALAAGLVHRLALDLGARGALALSCAVVFAAAVFATPFHRFLGSYPPAIVCVLLALRSFVRHLESGRARPLWAAGLLCGLAAVFKHDVGAYTAAALAAGLIAAATARSDRLAGLRDAFGPLLRLGAAAALPVAAVAAALAPFAGREMLDALLLWPATDFRDARPEAYPSLLPVGLYDPDALKRQLLYNLGYYLSFAIPFFAWIAGAGAATAAWRRRAAVRAGAATALVAAFAGHYAAAHVQINTHLISLSFYGAALALLVWQALEPVVPARRAGRVLAALFLAGWAGALAVAPAGKLLTSGRAQTPVDLPKLSGVHQSRQGAERTRELVRFVHERVPPQERVYVGAHRHDTVLIGDTTLYFVLDRLPATRFHELHPGVADTAPVQREMIRDLEENDVPLVVLRRHFADETLDAVLHSMRERLPQVGATALDAWLEERFVEAARFGHYTVLVRRDAG